MEGRLSGERILKLGFISGAVIFIMVTIIGLLMPGDIHVSRTININAPADSVINYANDLVKWKQWIEGADSAELKLLSPNSSGAGAKMRMGTYEVSITSSGKDSVAVLWKGDNSDPMTSVFYTGDDTVKHTSFVNWTFIQHIPWYPWERLSSIMNDKIIGTPMELSLNNLKKVVEEGVR